MANVTTKATEKPTTINPVPVTREGLIAELNARLTFMDPDSSRNVEVQWLQRHAEGLPTYGLFHQIDAAANAPWDDVTNYLQGHFAETGYYKSAYLWRNVDYQNVEIEEDGQTVTKAVVGKYVVADRLEDGSVIINAFGSEEFVDGLKAHFKNTYRLPNTVHMTTVSGFGANGPVLSNTPMEVEKLNRAYPNFYPELTGKWQMNQMIDDYLEANSRALVLVGEPGTGKTTLLRQIMIVAAATDKAEKDEDGNVIKRVSCLLVQGDAAVRSPELVPFIQSFVERQDGLVVVAIEDADLLVKARADGNTAMQALLGLLDGVAESRLKMVISTNLPNRDSIDEALLRPGRTHVTIGFRALKGAAEINAARAELKLPALKGLAKDVTMSLAEALNYKEDVVDNYIGPTSGNMDRGPRTGAGL